jgi:hypothetical protein
MPVTVAKKRVEACRTCRRARFPWLDGTPGRGGDDQHQSLGSRDWPL